MKALTCNTCGDLRAIRSGDWVTCTCGRAHAHFADPNFYITEVWAEPEHRSEVRIVSIHPTAFQTAFGLPLQAHQWRESHDRFCGQPSLSQSLHHTAQRNCWLLIVKPGEVSNVVWAAAAPQAPEVAP